MDGVKCTPTTNACATTFRNGCMDALLTSLDDGSSRVNRLMDAVALEAA